MRMYPFGSRPVPRQVYNQPAPKQETPSDFGDIFKHTSFSPELSFLLSMTLKDGLDRHKIIEMLKSIEPHVSSSDRQAIRSILSAQRMAEEYKRHAPVDPPTRSGVGLSSFSRFSRQQALIDILSRYASGDSVNILKALSRSARMQENFERMIRRIEKLRQMDKSSPEQMFEAISMFLPPEEQSKMRNLQNMMRMMGSMKNFKPEDMFKFMGGFK